MHWDRISYHLKIYYFFRLIIRRITTQNLFERRNFNQLKVIHRLVNKRLELTFLLLMTFKDVNDSFFIYPPKFSRILHVQLPTPHLENTRSRGETENTFYPCPETSFYVHVAYI